MTKARAKKINGARKQCACGCGRRADATFAPGHDSKLHSLVMRIAAGEADLADLPKLAETREYLGRAKWMTAKLRKAVGVEKSG